MVTVGEDFIKSKGFQNKLQSLIDESDLSVLTPKQIRHDLEEHYGLDRDTLRQDPWKTMIGELIDNCVTKKLEQKEKVKETTEKRDASPKKRKSSTEDDKKEDKAPRKRAKKAETISSDEVEEEFMASEEEDDKEKKEESEREEEDEDEDPVETNVVKSKKSAASVSVKGKPYSAKNEETIKRLKGFINKCGVRKVWSRELAGCNSARAEINRLQTILKELGVEGRPSNEKCQAVKRERELKKEFESLDTSNIIKDDGAEEESNDELSESEEQEENDEDEENDEEESEEGDEENDEEESSEDEFKGSEDDDDE
ncbi:hypothetical protein G6F47_009243 [Rhizopus delemar]|nr:hypothetical protein G6F54_007805 [Rhizopus delemar]KAG1551057.1 hypothetical protein G6F49_009103 [Rhizopus delemar]KAG1593026.1 hypothetical protein G6F47_009243 [Rhizopus delemar]KAG1640087.1 hypothetical protein G6F44_007182 [Rhizopus delemar]